MSIALVTGAAGGLGKAICFALADKGFKIVALDRLNTQDLCKQFVGIESMLEKVIGGVDFSDPSSIAPALAPFLPNKDWITLVNNAGVSVGGKLLESTLDQWNLMMNVNLTSPFILSQMFVRNAKGSKTQRSIINISSMVGIVGAKKPGYAASKAGIIGLTKSVAMQAGPYIRCNAIYPGAINTSMIADWDDEVRHKIIATTPLGRISEPTEIASIVSFLADYAQSGYLTGTIINATGGQYLGQ